MSWRLAAAIVAAVLAVGSNWPGIRDARAGTFRPRPASWGPWAAAMATGAGAAVMSGAWPSAAYTGACAAGCAAILVLGWPRRDRGGSRRQRQLDAACAALALAGVGLLALADADPALLSAAAAAAVAVAADLAAYLPTFRDGWKDPAGQPAAMYAGFAAAAVLTLAAERVPAGMIYPAYLLAADGGMALIVVGRRALLSSGGAGGRAARPDTTVTVPARTGGHHG
jgi:hypothetical protein